MLEQPFDLLLLDLMLPGMDGFTICRKVREAKDIPILMVTALGKDVDKIRGLGYGADDYIEKPFSPSVLVARVKAHLARYRRLKPAAAETTLLTAGPLAADTAGAVSGLLAFTEGTPCAMMWGEVMAYENTAGLSVRGAGRRDRLGEPLFAGHCRRVYGAEKCVKSGCPGTLRPSEQRSG